MISLHSQILLLKCTLNPNVTKALKVLPFVSYLLNGQFCLANFKKNIYIYLHFQVLILQDADHLSN